MKLRDIEVGREYAQARGSSHFMCRVRVLQVGIDRNPPAQAWWSRRKKPDGVLVQLLYAATGHETAQDPFVVRAEEIKRPWAEQQAGIEQDIARAEALLAERQQRDQDAKARLSKLCALADIPLVGYPAGIDHEGRILLSPEATDLVIKKLQQLESEAE